MSGVIALGITDAPGCYCLRRALQCAGFAVIFRDRFSKEDDLVDAECAACFPEPVNLSGFNSSAQITYGLTVEHRYQSMREFVDFLGFVNQQLHTKSLPRLETMLMSANFSSVVGEFRLAGP